MRRCDFNDPRIFQNSCHRHEIVIIIIIFRVLLSKKIRYRKDNRPHQHPPRHPKPVNIENIGYHIPRQQQRRRRRPRMILPLLLQRHRQQQQYGEIQEVRSTRQRQRPIRMYLCKFHRFLFEIMTTYSI
jgi:hypothetical protein